MELVWYQNDLIAIIVGIRYFSRSTPCESVGLPYGLPWTVRDLKIEP